MSESHPSKDPIARFAESKPLLPAGVETAAQQAVHRAFASLGDAGPQAKSFLHGDWLHEPLHAILTDVPVGSWTVTFLCDLATLAVTSEKLENAADISLDLGLLGAAGAAVAGITDWSEIKEPRVRRLGSAHALLNIAATGLMGASSWLRHRGGNRPKARLLAAAGYLVTSLSAHLGGNLVYEHGIGVRPSREAHPDPLATL